MIVVHNYISQKDSKSRASGKAPNLAASGRAVAHVKYIQHRPGEDREEGGREFFDETGNELDAKELRATVRKASDGSVTVHTLTFSPEINIGDKRALTAEVLQKLGADKGQDLRWFAVEHNNTDHYHVHVVVLGKDKAGKDVFIKKVDYQKMRDWGDAYLERMHPIEMAHAREIKERQKAERQRTDKETREKAREERIREGLELPWMHKKIIREQLEPYSEWKKAKKEKQIQKELERKKEQERSERPGGAKQKTEDQIRAAGMNWTKDSSLKELRELNEFLWDSYSNRIDSASYGKLVGWIKDKEQEEKYSKGQARKGTEGSADNGNREKEFEYLGKKYSEKSSYEDLRQLTNKIYEPNAKRLPIGDYQSLRGWMENADRARWQGVLRKQIAFAKIAYAKEQKQNYHPNNSRAPIGPGLAKGTWMFGPIAAVGQFAYSMVMIFDFGGGGGGGRGSPFGLKGTLFGNDAPDPDWEDKLHAFTHPLPGWQIRLPGPYGL